MVGETEIGELRPGRRWMIASAVGVAGLMGLSIVVDEAVNERDDIVLSHSEVIDGGAGGSVWRGALTNLAADGCRDLMVEMRFLDRNGRLLGELRRRAAALGVGRRFDLEAALPSGAVDLQIYALRWRSGDASIELGPFRPRELGRLPA